MIRLRPRSTRTDTRFPYTSLYRSACLAFEHNPQPTLTASAAQVRQPIYRSSVGLWRHYERELAPLRRRLEAAGVRIDDTGAAACARPRTPPPPTPRSTAARRVGKELVSTCRTRRSPVPSNKKHT